MKKPESTRLPDHVRRVLLLIRPFLQTAYTVECVCGSLVGLCYGMMIFSCMLPVWICNKRLKLRQQVLGGNRLITAFGFLFFQWI